MGLFDRFKKEQITEAAPVEEAAYTLAQESYQANRHQLEDEDDWMYRPIGVSGAPIHHSALTDEEVHKARLVGEHMFRNHAVGGALAEMIVDRVLGAGVTFKATDKQIQAVVDAFVADPDNCLDSHLHRLCLELHGLYGELFLPLFITKENADVRLGYLHPDQVERIIWCQGDAKKPMAFIQKAPALGEKRLLWIVPHQDPDYQGRYAPHPAITDANEPNSVMGVDGLPVVLPCGADGELAPEMAQVMSDYSLDVAGYAFYHRANALVSGRGVGMYKRIDRYLKAVDDFLFGTIRNEILRGAILWHVQKTDAKPADIINRAKDFAKRPKSGTVIVTDEKEKWNEISSNGTASSKIHEIVVNALKFIGISAAIPSHELGGEGDSNRSTAKEAKAISTARAKRMQLEITAMVLSWLNYQVDQKYHRGMFSNRVKDFAIEVVLPELNSRDETEVAQSVKDGVGAMISAVDANLVLEHDARAYLYNLLGQDMPGEDEFTKQREQRQANAPAALVPTPAPAQPVASDAAQGPQALP